MRKFFAVCIGIFLFCVCYDAKGDIMSDPNAVAMEDCIHVVVHLDNDSIPPRREWAEEGETCLGNHNYHAKNAVCKKC